MKGYLTVKETAEKWGVSVRCVNRYIQEGRLPGCEKLAVDGISKGSEYALLAASRFPEIS